MRQTFGQTFTSPCLRTPARQTPWRSCRRCPKLGGPITTRNDQIRMSDCLPPNNKSLQPTRDVLSSSVSRFVPGIKSALPLCLLFPLLCFASQFVEIAAEIETIGYQSGDTNDALGIERVSSWQRSSA